jgi:hypothetical protein
MKTRHRPAFLATCIAASLLGFAWPARAGAPAGRYTIDSTGAGTVFDNATGLMWQRSVPGSYYTWLDALAYCQSLDLLGHADWRLPTLKELHTIVDIRRYDPAIDVDAFPGTPWEFFWSSTPFANPSYTENAWGLNANNGYATYYDTTGSYRVRCVR